MVDNPKHFVIWVIGILIVIGLGIALVQAPWKSALQNEGSGATTTNKSGATAEGRGTEGTSAGQPPKVQPSVLPPTSYDAIVTYTSTGFSPKTLEVKAGTSVRFINKSSGTMWVSTSNTSGPYLYSDFNQGSSIGRGGTFDFNFSRQGTWPYYNINDKTKTGIIIVK